VFAILVAVRFADPIVSLPPYQFARDKLQMRLDEAKRVGYGFALPDLSNASVVLNVPKLHQNTAMEIAA